MKTISRNFMKSYEEVPYHEKISNTINFLGEENKNSFKKALKYYKFDKEVYIPNNSIKAKKEYKNKNYLLNTIVNFNHKLQSGKEYFTSLKKQTDKFSRQYKLVESKNENTQKNNYFKQIHYIYKIRGYNDRNITYSKNENVFDPSLLLEEQTKFNIVCKTEEPIEIKRDTKYMEQFHSLLREKKGKSKKEEEEEDLERNNYGVNKSVTFAKQRKDSSLYSDDYNKEKENVKKKIMEEIKIKNMSLREIKKINQDLRNEILETEESLKLIDDEYKNKKQYKVIEDIFLSLKGMLRSAKYRKNENESENNNNDNISEKKSNISDSGKKENKKHILILDKNNKEENEEEKIKKEEEEKKIEEEKNRKIYFLEVEKPNFERSKKTTLTQKERREKFEREKQNKLTRVYNNIIKNNFKQEEKDVKNYIKLYTDKIIKDPDINKGSNLHGFLNDFQKQISKTNIPEMANHVEEEMANINRLNRINRINNIDKETKKVIESINNPEILFDMDEGINNLGYEYTDVILRK